LWHKKSVPVIVEKVLLALCMIALVGNMFSNQFNFDRTQRVLIGLVLFFLACFLAYTVHQYNQKEKAADKTIGNPAKATPTVEPTPFKVLTEIDLEPHCSTTGHQIQSGVFIAYDALVQGERPDKFLMTVNLRVRFDGKEALAGRVQRVSVFLRREAKDEIRQTEVGYSATEEASHAEQSLVDLPIPYGLTPYYRLGCQAELEKGWGKLLDDHCFLRIVTEAKDQPPYCVDLNVDWETARLFDSVADLSPRSSGQC
jgi:hypothetical protein